MHLQEYGGEEKEKHTYTRSPHWVGRGVARRRVHDMRVKGLSKSRPTPRRSVTSFSRLFLI
jgi:hypothetical protein